ncbi:response regulator [Dankookia rubra]|uniref:Response regulator n=1 Tax=Dankookia rubra TaxID=1442381 RepID=A0A4R5Q2Q2_9PROT|nr:response regulator [Dankookia rubra]TDH56976.1 response regulator [Dankookia rubra]
MAARLLITDDEPLILLSLADLFEDEDVDVTLASDGLEALAAAQTLGDTLDVLVTDLDMPRMAGRDLIRALRLDRPSLPVVIVSGSASPDSVSELRRTCGGHGPLLLVHKPFASCEVKAAVRRVIAGRETGRATTPQGCSTSKMPVGRPL